MSNLEDVDQRSSDFVIPDEIRITLKKPIKLRAATLEALFQAEHIAAGPGSKYIAGWIVASITRNEHWRNERPIMLLRVHLQIRRAD